MPAGAEPIARKFYAGLLGMTEVAKPAGLAKRGGAWFTSGDVTLHLGVEAEFRPARKAHPALRCSNYAELIARLRKAGVEANDDGAIPGVTRCHIFDPFGNRIELIAEQQGLNRARRIARLRYNAQPGLHKESACVLFFACCWFCQDASPRPNPYRPPYGRSSRWMRPWSRSPMSE